MDSEERPNKLRKLSHGSATQSKNAIDHFQLSHDTLMATSTDVPINNENNASLDIDPATAPPPTISQATFSTQHQPPTTTTTPSQPLSKSAQKKLRKRLEWEAGAEDRRLKRKEKTKEKKLRIREQRQQEAAEREAKGLPSIRTPRPPKPIRLPVTFLIDCSFDDKMMEKERISLGSQVTRSYSDNAKARYQAHLVVSSWGGEMKERFDTVLGGQYKGWKGVIFDEEDFVEAAKKAKGRMEGPQGGKMDGIFRKYAQVESQTQVPPPSPETTTTSTAPTNETAPPTPLPESEIIYLTSDSPNTLTELNPHSTYIIGGIVDKNRHKGLCYRIACDRGVKTAKLPIGEFMEMQSRFVLATNHVVEIMVRWLECGDWGESFMKVIPKRKGGRLRGDGDGNGNEDGNGVKVEADDDGIDNDDDGDVHVKVEDDDENEDGDEGRGQDETEETSHPNSKDKQEDIGEEYGTTGPPGAGG